MLPSEALKHLLCGIATLFRSDQVLGLLLQVHVKRLNQLARIVRNVEASLKALQIAGRMHVFELLHFRGCKREIDVCATKRNTEVSLSPG
jgi:hypothetical protein